MANGYIGQIHIDQTDYKIGSTLFAVLDTSHSIGSISTSDGVTTFNVPLDGFVSTDGVTVHIQFKQENTVTSNLQLKVANDSAKTIINPNGALTWKENSVISFTNDGTNWVINSNAIDGAAIQNLSLGNITNDGKLQTNDVTIASGDKLVITDASDGNKIARASLAFGNTANGTYLSNIGTWTTPPNTKYKLITGATNSAITNAAGTNGSTYLNLVEDSSVLNSHKLTGTNITITSTADGEIKFEGKAGTVTSVRVQGTAPIVSSTNTASNSTLNTTISLASGYGDTQNPYAAKTAHYILAGPTSGAAAAPEFRALVAEDIPAAIARLASPDFTGTPTAPTVSDATDNSTKIATTAFVAAAINSKLSANDAMLFKGTIGTNGNPGTLPTNGYQAGWTYRVVTAGTYANQVCEVGDLLIAVNDGPLTGSSVINADWTVAQTNIDGSIYMGNNSLTSGQLLIADGTAGKIKSSGYTIASPTATGDILYASSTSAYSVLSAGNENEVLTMSNSGTPVWAAAQHYISHLYVTNSSGSSNTTSALTNGNVYLKLYDTNTARESHKISGAGGATVTTDASANIIITSKKYKSAGSANAFTGLVLGYNDGSAQTETMTVNTAAQIGYVNQGILYIKSIKYSTTSVSTGVSEDNSN